MARKESIISIQDREQLLTFKVREMSASKLENWLARATLLVADSGSQTKGGLNMETLGSVLVEKGLAMLGKVDFDKAKPLLDELLGCCSRVVERVEERCTPESVDAYIQDVRTLFTLRMEAIKLNLGFFLNGDEAPVEDPADSPASPTTALH